MRTPRPAGGCHQCWTSPCGKLARRRPQDLFAQQRRSGVDERHGVLQLIAKTERPARLIKARPSPDAGSQHLVEQPAVGQEVHRRVRRLDGDGAQRPRPVGRDLGERRACGRRAPEPAQEDSRVGGVSPRAEGEDDLPLLPVDELEGHLDRQAGSRPAPVRPDRRARPRHAGAAIVPLRPRNSSLSPLTERSASLQSRKDTRVANSPL